jgi:hypothetical protein
VNKIRRGLLDLFMFYLGTLSAGKTLQSRIMELILHNEMHAMWKQGLVALRKLLTRAVVKKSGNLNFLEPSGPLQFCNGTALPLNVSPFAWRNQEVPRCSTKTVGLRI